MRRPDEDDVAYQRALLGIGLAMLLLTAGITLLALAVMAGLIE